MICHNTKRYIIIDYIPHIVHFIPVSYFVPVVPLNSPQLFHSSSFNNIVIIL